MITIRPFSVVVAALFVLNIPMASSSETLYQKPEPIVDKILRADGFSSPIFNYQKTALIKRFRQDMPSIAYVARPQLKLAGERFNPKNYTAVTNAYFKKLVYFDAATKKEKEISFPEGSILRETLWSPNGKYLAVSKETDSCQEVWIVQIPSLKKTKIPNVCLNAISGRTIEWVGDDQILMGIRTPMQKAPIPFEKETPTGPVVQESKGVVSQNRTIPDLIRTAQDEKIFAFASEQQLVIYNVKTGSTKKIGKPDLFASVASSPNKKLLLVKTFVPPFSKAVPSHYFESKLEVWNLSGKVIQKISQGGPFESLPIEGVPQGIRSVRWVNSEDQTLAYVQALDKGDWNVAAEYRDELFLMPILDSGKSKPESILKLKNRFGGLTAMNESNSFIVYDYERDKQWIIGFWLQKDETKKWKTKTLFSFNENDDYANPGDPVLIRNASGRTVVAIDATGPKSIFLEGKGSSTEGDRPFLRKMELESLKTEELFRSELGTYESFAAFTNSTLTDFITSFESQKISPRLYIRKPKSKEFQLLLADANPYEVLSKIKKEVITYQRKDGVKLSGVLYYPLNYEAGKKYPAIIHAYPLEYTDAATAGQVRGTQDRYSTPYKEDIVYNALRGYVVLDDAQMPIVGHPETKNDTFIEQLSESAKAAVDTLKSRGLIDPKKVGVIGHSYGAYMVANLLTHTDLFATGIAKSGAYNRTLTPFGFQGERRPLWKAKDVYLKMSPFLSVDKMKKPILLMHGMMDNNPGTFTMQTERYFEALKGQGATAKLVLLPEESHGYASLESVQHTLHEIFAWFDQYLK